jgi:hypothetical protein
VRWRVSLESKRERERMSSITISTPKEWDKNTALAVLDAWIDALDRGYTLSIKESEGE